MASFWHWKKKYSFQPLFLFSLTRSNRNPIISHSLTVHAKYNQQHYSTRPPFSFSFSFSPYTFSSFFLRNKTRSYTRYSSLPQPWHCLAITAIILPIRYPPLRSNYYLLILFWHRRELKSRVSACRLKELKKKKKKRKKKKRKTATSFFGHFFPSLSRLFLFTPFSLIERLIFIRVDERERNVTSEPRGGSRIAIEEGNALVF